MATHLSGPVSNQSDSRLEWKGTPPVPTKVNHPGFEAEGEQRPRISLLILSCPCGRLWARWLAGHLGAQLTVSLDG